MPLYVYLILVLAPFGLVQKANSSAVFMFGKQLTPGLARKFRRDRGVVAASMLALISSEIALAIVYFRGKIPYELGIAALWVCGAAFFLSIGAHVAVSLRFYERWKRGQV